MRPAVKETTMFDASVGIGLAIFFVAYLVHALIRAERF